MRPSIRIAIAMAAAAVGVVVFRTWFGGEGLSAPTEERGASEAGSAKDEAHAIEVAADSRDDDGVAAERTSDVAPAPKHPPRDLPVTWVEGAFTLIEEAPVPSPPWPDGRPPVLPDVVVDPARLDGSFLPMLIDGPDDEEAPDDPMLVPLGDPRRVRVVDGKFRFDAHGATAMLVTGLELDHRLAAADRGVEISADAPATVRAHWIPDVLLHVLDAKTKAELSDVAVVARPWSSQVEEGRVQPADVMVGWRASPLHVSWKQGAGYVLDAGLLWIGAPGHAWRPRNLELAPGSTKTVELDAGAALVVTVKGDDAERPLERRPRIRLRDVGGRTAAAAEVRDEKEQQLRRLYGDEPRPETSRDWLVFDVLAADEPMEFDGLRAGEFVASLEIGDGSAPLVLARANVKLVAGATERLVLTIQPDSIVEPVRVEGTLYVPPSWGRVGSFVLGFAPEGIVGSTKSDRCSVPLSDMAVVPGNVGWYRWRIGPIQPGTYTIREPRTRFETRIEVGRAGRSDVTIVLPEAAVLVVKIVDEKTREPLELEYLMWHVLTGGVQEYEEFDGMATLRWDPIEQALVGSVRSGAGRIDGGSVAYELLGDPNQPKGKHVVHTGRNEIVLIARHRCGVDLRLDRSVANLIGARKLLRWTCLATGESDEFWWSSNLVHFLRPTRNGPPVDLDVADDARRAGMLGPNCFSLLEPGRYRLWFPDVPSIAPFEVDVPEGEFVKYVVERR